MEDISDAELAREYQRSWVLEFEARTQAEVEIERLRAELERALTRVRDLSEQWDAEADANEDTHPRQSRVLGLCARDLRAALADATPETDVT